MTRQKWLWLMATVLGIGLTALFYIAGSPGGRPTLNLLAADQGGKVRIEWDRSAQPVLGAKKASVLIVDGDRKLETELSAKALRAGELTYRRKSPDLEIRLRVYGADSDPVQELTRLLGLPAAPKSDETAEPDIKWVEMGKRAPALSETASISAPAASDTER